MSGIDWETRQKILGVLKENEGRISYEDLEGMGVFKPGDLAEGGFKRWLQEHDIGANDDKMCKSLPPSRTNRTEATCF